MPAHILRPVSAWIRSVIENLQCEEGSAIVGKTFCRRGGDVGWWGGGWLHCCQDHLLMDLLAICLSCLACCFTPSRPPLPIHLLYCSRGQRGCQYQVQKMHAAGRRERKRRQGNGERIDGTQVAGLNACFFFPLSPPHLHKQNVFFFLPGMIPSLPPSSFHSRTPRLFSYRIIVFIIIFFRLQVSNSAFLVSQNKFHFLLPLFFLKKQKTFSSLYSYSQLPFFFSFDCTSRFTFSPHLSCSRLAELCILLTCCSAVFWRWRLIFLACALQRPHCSLNRPHSSPTHLVFLPWLFLTNTISSSFQQPSLIPSLTSGIFSDEAYA